MLYSVRMRSASTSNCRAPATPTIHSLPKVGRNTCAAPSSASWSRARPRCLERIGSSARTFFSSSGAKLGMPVKRSSSPSVSASPIRRLPWFGMPRMSPAQASSASSRSRARKSTGLWIDIVLPERTWSSFMPRSKRPEQRRTKAMRSRCLGSMFAWILNTKPETFSSCGSTVRVSVGAGRGGGASSTSPWSSSRTPKLLTALPKKTGVRCPSR